jgi:hypothetical protein
MWQDSLPVELDVKRAQHVYVCGHRQCTSTLPPSIIMLWHQAGHILISAAESAAVCVVLLQVLLCVWCCCR